MNASNLPISQRLIISVYDSTGNWARPYIKAGYPVILWDYKHEGCIFEGFSQLLCQIEEAIEAGYIPYGLLFAPPCTAISKVGNRFWSIKDIPKENYESFSGTIGFNSETEEAVASVSICLVLIEQIKKIFGIDICFWALENPAGRMENIVPELKPYRLLSFQPYEFGDPYSKLTILWGQFNTNLPKTPVTPIKAKTKNHNAVDAYLQN
jgi:hypothetical protein